MNINCFSVNNKQIVTKEQSFLIGENLDVMVLVTLCQNNGEYTMTAWLDGIIEIDSVAYCGANRYDEIIEAMESLISDNEEYILELSSTLL